MKRINEILRNKSLKPKKYYKQGKVYIIELEDYKVVLKKNTTDIYKYLDDRNFDYYPNTETVDGYDIIEYIEDDNLMDDSKINKIIYLMSLLHNKTTFYKLVDNFEYKDVYESISKVIIDRKEYYNNIMDLVETENYMSPSHYFLARNITNIFNALDYCEYELKKWYEQVKDLKKMRQSIIHNNLDMSHYLNNKLISWGKAKFDFPVFDIEQIYRRTYKDFVWDELLNDYLSQNMLHDEEIQLLHIIISIPEEIKFTDNEYQNTIIANNLIEYISKTGELVLENKKVE